MKKSILLFLTASCFLAAGLNAQTDANAATAGTFNYYAVLLGANEFTPTTPTGDPTAVGFARVLVDTTANTVTFTIADTDLPSTSIVASHIHEKGAVCRVTS
jgi:Cu/Zn superoxide dismutase